ncbi:MAG: low molecular weight protein-tyrosine-phosphatase [Prevotella sp.]
MNTPTNITPKHRLLFICLGNICRSPAAEGVMKAKVHAAKLDDQFFIDSAGIGDWHVGQLPDSRMRERGACRGYRLDSRARQIRQSDFEDFDLLLVMDRENYRIITSKAPDEESRKKVRMLTDYLQEHKNTNIVPDPYYGDLSDFDYALDLIEDACDGLLEQLLH